MSYYLFHYGITLEHRRRVTYEHRRTCLAKVAFRDRKSQECIGSYLFQSQELQITFV